MFNQLERSYGDGFFRLLEMGIRNVVLSRGVAMVFNYSRYTVSETQNSRAKESARRPTFLVDPKNPVESNIIIQTVRYGPDFRHVYIFSAVQQSGGATNKLEKASGPRIPVHLARQ